MIANATIPRAGWLLPALLLAVGATAVPASAATPLGAPATITTHHGNSQAVARSAAGRFVVAWDEEQAPGNPVAQPGLYLRVHDASGVPQGVPVLVDTMEAVGDSLPALAMNATGGFVVAWARRGADIGPAHGFDFYAQRFAADGTRIGATQHVAQGTGHNIAQPAVALAADGSYVVAWQTRTYQLDLPIPLSTIHTVSIKVHARQYGINGLPRGEPIVVDSNVPVLQGFSGYPNNLAVGIDASGGFTVAFEAYLGVSNSIQMRRYTPEGSARGLRARVSQLASFWGLHPNLLMNADGSSVIAWTGGCQYQYRVGCAAYFQRYAADGRKQGAITQIANPGPGSFPSMPKLAGGPNGAFLALWQAELPTGRIKAYGLAYSADGVPDGAAFAVQPDEQLREQAVSVASDANGDFVVAWRNFDFDVDTGAYSAPLQFRRFLRH